MSTMCRTIRNGSFELSREYVVNAFSPLFSKTKALSKKIHSRVIGGYVEKSLLMT